ncbi:MAG: flagellar biosynthetic protein FliQ [Oligoflexia bacterium]|nr:flagellar biosynthetic protein FliQ [Oligoflexia bacterium]
MISELLVKALETALLVSALPLGSGCLAAQLVALIQSIFQIQEQTLGYVVKFAVMSAVIVIFSNYLLGLVAELFEDALKVMLLIGKGAPSW